MLPLYYIVVLYVAVQVSAYWAWRRIISARAESIVRTLALITNRNIPLPDALRAAARFEKRHSRRILETLAGGLEAGLPLDDALHRSFRACPPAVLGVIRAGRRGGTLPSLLRALAVDMRREKEPIFRCSPAILYFLILFLFVFMLTTMLVTFMFPHFRDIFADFGLRSAPCFDYLAHAVDSIIRLAPLIATAAGLAALIALERLYRRFYPPPPDRVPLISLAIDALAWSLPGLNRLLETRAMIRQLPILQAAVRAGHDLVSAARQAACAQTNARLRLRMLRWAEHLTRGDDPTESARVLGFPAQFRRALSVAGGPAELSTSFEYLLTYYRSLYAYWEHALASAAIPLIVLFWGVCVAWVVLAIFTPIYDIVDSLIISAF